MWMAWVHQNNNISPPAPQWAMNIPRIISWVAKKRSHFLPGLHYVLTTLTKWKTQVHMTRRTCRVQRGRLLTKKSSCTKVSDIYIYIYIYSNKLPCGCCSLAVSIQWCLKGGDLCFRGKISNILRNFVYTYSRLTLKTRNTCYYFWIRVKKVF